ncbi:MAG: FAD-binding oxidoreductase [Deltaproteobacteria bacterium]|nr:MAG: FAD-binding oxidoreductase [Deltaproteobacteria bacterium]
MLPNVSHSDHPLDLRAVARDLWPGGTLDFWQGRSAPEPDLVFWPESDDEVLAVLQAATAEGIAVVPYGAGSGVCGGARGGYGRWVLDVKRLDHIGELDELRRTVDVEAGVNGQHLEDWLNERGYTLGHSPSSIWCSTVGGWAAARGAGQFSSRYGVFEDMVLSLTCVSPGRGRFTVGEGGDAPDEWMELLLGSEGTLGVITRMRLRVWPLPEKRWLRGYKVDDVDTAVRCMRRLMQAELHPAVVRLYDPVDTRIGGKTKPKKEHGSGQASFLKKWLGAVDGLPPVRKRLLALPLTLPGVLNKIADRISGSCLLIVGWEGDAEVVDALSAAGHALLCEEAEDLGESPGERWFHSRHAVSYKLAPIFERGGFADTMEVAMRWDAMVPVYEAVRDAVSETAVIMAHMSHLYPEGGSIYFSFAGKGDRDTYDQTWKNALAAVEASGATTTHHHGVGRLKAEVATREAGAARVGWERAKAELDPAGILNPGNVFVDAPVVDAKPPAEPSVADGLVVASVAAGADGLSEAAAARELEVQFPWAGDAPARWHRKRWEVAWTEVSGTVDGHFCWLGRGPRSAAGPDLRRVVAEAEDARVAVPAVPFGSRWMGRAKVEAPWSVARDLLRSDLRPAVLTVEGDELVVGFRGPAAEVLGALASRRVPGGLTACEYRAFPLASGPLQPCEPQDPRAVAVTELDVLMPRETT